MSLIQRVAGSRIVRRGFFPIVVGRDVQVERGGGVVFAAGHDLRIERGGGQWLASAGQLEVHQGGGACLVANSAHIERGLVGLVVARKVELGPGARVLLQKTPAVLAAAALGVIAGWLIGRRR